VKCERRIKTIECVINRENGTRVDVREEAEEERIEENPPGRRSPEERQRLRLHGKRKGLICAQGMQEIPKIPRDSRGDDKGTHDSKRYENKRWRRPPTINSSGGC
jgi:hypothetical protein